MRNFVKIKSTRTGEITLSFSDTGTSSPCHEFLMSQICVLWLFAKIKFSPKFQNLQYQPPWKWHFASRLIAVYCEVTELNSTLLIY